MIINEFHRPRSSNDLRNDAEQEQGACMDALGTCRPQLRPTVLLGSVSGAPPVAAH